MSVKQVIARTYPKTYNNPMSEVKRYLKQGYKIVMFSKFKVDSTSEGNEYILEKEIAPCEECED